MNKIIGIIILSLTFLTCKDEGTDVKESHCSDTDTTSHNFLWNPPVLLGDGAGSILYDVAIVRENPPLVYAVGEVYRRDSTGNWDPNAYNVARWDGENWLLLRVPVRDYGGFTGFFRLKTIFVFRENDIWFAGDADLIHFDGTSYQSKALFMQDISFNGQVLKMWGTSGSNLYLVGRNGAIYHFSGSGWQKVDSGTTLPINDIWGATDSNTSEQTILAIASGSSIEEGEKLLNIRGTTVTALPDDGLSWDLSSVWFVPGCQYYLVGAGIHYKGTLDNSTWTAYPAGVVTSYASGRIRGNKSNDVFVVGSFMEVAHFNGVSWYNYHNEIRFSNGALGGIAIKGNLVVAVGLQGQQAVAITGKR